LGRRPSASLLLSFPLSPSQVTFSSRDPSRSVAFEGKICLSPPHLKRDKVADSCSCLVGLLLKHGFCFGVLLTLPYVVSPVMMIINSGGRCGEEEKKEFKLPADGVEEVSDSGWKVDCLTCQFLFLGREDVGRMEEVVACVLRWDHL